MRKQVFQSGKFMLLPAVLLMTGSAYSDSFSSSTSPPSIPEPGQQLTYAGNNPTVNEAAGSPFSLGIFNSVPTATSTTTIFALTLNDNTNGASVVFSGAVAGSPPGTITFTGTGTEDILGVEYATIVDDGFVYAVQQTDAVNFGKGTSIPARFDAVPEPRTTFLIGFGFSALAAIAWQRLRARRALS